MRSLPIAAAIVFAAVMFVNTVGSEPAQFGGALAPPLEKTSYLTATIDGPKAIVTVTNPRQDEGLVFFVTDIISSVNLLVTVPPGSLIPELWQFGLASDDNPERISLNRPFPLETDLQVEHGRAGIFHVIFHGYYARWIGDATHYE